MPTITKIKYSQLEDRLDSEYYKSEYLEIYPNIKKYKFPVKKITEVTSLLTHLPGFLRDEYVIYCKKGIPYLRQVNIRENEISLEENVVYIPFDIHKILKVSQLKSNDLVLTVTGAYYGVAAVVPESLGECNSCPDVVRIVTKNINSFYLSTFLNSKYGKLQLKRFNSGCSRSRILTSNIRRLIVPIPPQQFQLKIENVVKESISKRNLADQKYEQAKQLLEKELGFDKLKLKEEKTFEANFSNLKHSLRFDSEYYKPKYKQIIEFLENSGFEVKKLKDVVKISNNKIDPTKEPTKKFKYVPIAKINQNGEIEERDEFNGWQAPSRARMLIKKGDVLVSSLGGSIDKIALVPEELNNSLATTGTFVINSDNFYSEFLFLLFRTELIKLQLEQKTAGAIMTAVPKTTFGDLLIPIIPKQKQRIIAELIKQSFTLRKEAKQLLQESKEKVEKMILSN